MTACRQPGYAQPSVLTPQHQQLCLPRTDGTHAALYCGEPSGGQAGTHTQASCRALAATPCHASTSTPASAPHPRSPCRWTRRMLRLLPEERCRREGRRPMSKTAGEEGRPAGWQCYVGKLGSVARNVHVCHSLDMQTEVDLHAGNPFAIAPDNCNGVPGPLAPGPWSLQRSSSMDSTTRVRLTRGMGAGKASQWAVARSTCPAMVGPHTLTACE